VTFCRSLKPYRLFVLKLSLPTAKPPAAGSSWRNWPAGVADLTVPPVIVPETIAPCAVLAAAASDSAAMSGYGLGTLDNGELTFGTKATAANQHLIYNSTSGALFYDADGAGGAAQIQIATLTGHPALTAHDITLIG